MAKHRPSKWSKLKASMSPEARARVDARVHETLDAMPLAEIRKAIGTTQTDLAGQAPRFEDAGDPPHPCLPPD